MCYNKWDNIIKRAPKLMIFYQKINKNFTIKNINISPNKAETIIL